MPFASLVTGTVTILLFRRGFWYIRFVLAYLTIVWLSSVVLATLTRGESVGPRARTARRISAFLSQALMQEAYFFLLPFYVGSSVTGSIQAVFIALLVGGVLLSTFDRPYERWVLNNRWTGALFYAFSFFACLNFMLPVIAGMRNIEALYLSGVLAALLTPPMLEPWRRVLQPRGLLRSAAGLAVILALLRLVLPVIPPAPLNVVEGGFAKEIDPRTRLPRGEVRSVGRSELEHLACYTSIFAPLGLKGDVVHVWRHNGVEVDRIRLRDITGGRKAGYRTWSFKTNFGPHPEGLWTVDVETDAGQLMGRLSLRVTPSR
jgi:hypothetical protein